VGEESLTAEFSRNGVLFPVPSKLLLLLLLLLTLSKAQQTDRNNEASKTGVNGGVNGLRKLYFLSWKLTFSGISHLQIDHMIPQKFGRFL
jgi:hypothetical protein